MSDTVIQEPQFLRFETQGINSAAVCTKCNQAYFHFFFFQEMRAGLETSQSCRPRN